MTENTIGRIPRGYEWANYVLPRTTKTLIISDASTQWISELDPTKVPLGAKCKSCPKPPKWLDRYLSHGQDSYDVYCEDHAPKPLVSDI